MTLVTFSFIIPTFAPGKRERAELYIIQISGQLGEKNQNEVLKIFFTYLLLLSYVSRSLQITLSQDN